MSGQKASYQLMIDLETASTDPQAQILAIGAVAFSFDDFEIKDMFYAVVDQLSYPDGAKISNQTLWWWLRQPWDARKALFEQANTLDQALIELTMWAGEFQPCDGVWANSPRFDLQILGNAYRLVGGSSFWSYWQERDYRAIKALHQWLGEPLDLSDFEEGLSHRADHDALAQARQIMAVYQYLQQIKTTVIHLPGKVSAQEYEKSKKMLQEDREDQRLFSERMTAHVDWNIDALDEGIKRMTPWFISKLLGEEFENHLIGQAQNSHKGD